MEVLTVAGRGSDLAVAQIRIVIAALKEVYPELEIRIKEVTTSGDRDRRTALWELEGSGFFAAAVEDTLLRGEADFAVHSFKDLPCAAREGLAIAAVCKRRFAEDCLVAAERVGSIVELKGPAKIGTSSLRRAVQIKRLRKDFEVMAIRGNVETRIRKVERGEFDAVILARAGLERLGLGSKISVCFDPREFIPAPAQGAIAVQVRSDDAKTKEIVGAINDESSRVVAEAERKILAVMQCGCHAPVGAFAEIDAGQMEIIGFISDLDGVSFIRRQVSGPVKDAGQLAERIADELLRAGGKEILEGIER